MTQAERIVKMMEAQADVSRAQIAVDEARGRLDAAEDRLRQLRKACTHRDGHGKSTWKPMGMFGSECTLCLETDL